MEETRREKPITYDELYEKVKKIVKKEDELDVINRAYGFALAKHGDKKRLNGDPYISHPLEVAYILTDLNVDYITIACALLHETINHTDTSIDEVRENIDKLYNIKKISDSYNLRSEFDILKRILKE